MVGEYSPFWVLREMNKKKGHHHPTIPVSTMVLHEFSYKISIHYPTISFLDHIWEGIRSIININNSKSNFNKQLRVNEEIIDNPNEIAETLNDFFVNIGPNTESCIPRNPVTQPEKYLGNKNQVDFLISEISNEEVLEIIINLESKSTGPQSIPVNLLKLIPDLILAPLCKIISNSFSSGIFPDAIKICKVIPIHKGESNLDLNNYRPISLLSIFDKIIEKLMHKRLYNEILNNLHFNVFIAREDQTIYILMSSLIQEKMKQSALKCLQIIFVIYFH